MRVYTCDMCGKVMIHSDYILNLYDNYAGSTDDIHYDLCQDCVKKFKSMLKSTEVIKTQNYGRST